MAHDRGEDDIETRMMSKVRWLPPVRSPDDLPTAGVEEGAMCYVEGDDPDAEEVWEFTDGRWIRLG